MNHRMEPNRAPSARRRVRSHVWLATGAFSALFALILWFGGVFDRPSTSVDAALPERGVDPAPRPAEQLTPSHEMAELDAAREPEDSPGAAQRQEVPPKVQRASPARQAVVILNVEFDATYSELSRARILVGADGDPETMDEAEQRSIVVEPSFLIRDVVPIDVTSLFTKPGSTPSFLRVNVQTRPGCGVSQDVFVAIGPEVMANHSLLELKCRVELNCPRAVLGRIITADPNAQGRVEWLKTPMFAAFGLGHALGATVRPDGQFAIHAPDEGEPFLLVGAQNHVDRVFRVPLAGFGDIDLGEIVLERGNLVKGVAMLNGQPLADSSLRFVPFGAKAVRASPKSARGSTRAKFSIGGAGFDTGDPLLVYGGPLGVEEPVFELRSGELASSVTVRTDGQGRFELDTLRAGRHRVGLADSFGEWNEVGMRDIDVPASDLHIHFEADVVELEFVGESGGPDENFVVVEVGREGSVAKEERWVEMFAHAGLLRVAIEPGTSVTIRSGGREVVIPPSSRAGERNFRVVNGTLHRVDPR